MRPHPNKHRLRGLRPHQSEEIPPKNKDIAATPLTRIIRAAVQAGPRQIILSNFQMAGRVPYQEMRRISISLVRANPVLLQKAG
jgi:hypothetical protein